MAGSIISQSKAEPPVSRIWSAESFFEDARRRLSLENVSQLESIFGFGRKTGEISWGTGQRFGTFRVNLSIKGIPTMLFAFVSDGRGWFNFRGLSRAGVGKQDITRYTGTLKSAGLAVKETAWDGYPSFDLTPLH